MDKVFTTVNTEGNGALCEYISFGKQDWRIYEKEISKYYGK